MAHFSPGFIAAGPPPLSGNDSFTVLLLNCDGADTSTTFTDTSVGGANGNATVTGNAQVDVAQKVFGTGSLLSDGSGDDIRYASNVDWQFGTGDFTIDFRLRLSSLTTCSLMNNMNTIGTNGWAFRFMSGGTGIRFLTNSGSATDRAWSPSIGAWYHVAFARSGSTLKLFVDGTQLGADITNSEALSNGGGDPLIIGNSQFIGESLPGWMDEIMISKGIARWTSNFTPPADVYG